MSDYLDFELEIGGGPGTYHVTARSPQGEVRAQAQIALTTEEIAAIGALTGIGVRRSARTIGQKLFDDLFKGTVRDLFGRTQAQAQQQRRAGVRVRLAVLAADLAGIPWELLYDPAAANHLSLVHATPLVRTIPVLQPLEPIAAATPLKLLGMVSRPTGVPGPDPEKQLQRLAGWLKPLEDAGRVTATCIGPTWSDLQQALQTGTWHLFYFLGHGGFDEDNHEGFIALTDANGDEERAYATDIGSLLANHDSLRLVQLVSCDGSTSGVEDVFSSTAATLIQRGVPAVLAMQRPISDEAAAELTRVFYTSLANGLPVDVAVVEARIALRRFQNSAEWATPTLFLRAKDAVLFDMPAQNAPPAHAVPPTTPPLDPNAPRARLLTLATQPATAVPRPELRRVMSAAFSTSELKLFCDNLSDRLGQRVGVDELGGETKEMIVLNLIQFLDRRGMLQGLLDELKVFLTQ
jgi:hypothetical protein